MTEHGTVSRMPADVDPVPESDVWSPGNPNVVREYKGRNVVHGVGGETNVHGAQAGCRVSVSGANTSGTGRIARVRMAAAALGGAQLFVRFDDGHTEYVPASICRLTDR